MIEDPLKSQQSARSPRLRFCLMATLAILLDQITKQIMLEIIFYPPTWIKVTAFLNLVPVWNRGMSFGILSDGGVLVPIGLTSLALVVSAWLFWMVPNFFRLQRMAATLVAGGAVGNAIDRVRFGKVVDFIDLHYGGVHWPAFNLADAAITMGAILWGYSILFEQEASQK